MIVGFTGHQDLSEPVASYVATKMRLIIRKLHPSEGITALARGADQLFAHEVITAGAKLRVVIPSVDYERTFDGHDLARYKELLALATSIENLPFRQPSEEAYYAAGRRIVDLSDLVIAVWDGKPSKGLGGTADVVAYAAESSLDVVRIWPDRDLNFGDQAS